MPENPAFFRKFLITKKERCFNDVPCVLSLSHLFLQKPPQTAIHVAYISIFLSWKEHFKFYIEKIKPLKNWKHKFITKKDGRRHTNISVFGLPVWMMMTPLNIIVSNCLTDLIIFKKLWRKKISTLSTLIGHLNLLDHWIWKLNMQISLLIIWNRIALNTNDKQRRLVKKQNDQIN